MLIGADTIIGDILDLNPCCEEVFLSFDMPCMGCPSSRGETLAEACSIHDVDLNTVINALHERL